MSSCVPPILELEAGALNEHACGLGDENLARSSMRHDPSRGMDGYTSHVAGHKLDPTYVDTCSHAQPFVASSTANRPRRCGPTSKFVRGRIFAHRSRTIGYGAGDELAPEEFIRARASCLGIRRVS